MYKYDNRIPLTEKTSKTHKIIPIPTSKENPFTAKTRWPLQNKKIPTTIKLKKPSLENWDFRARPRKRGKIKRTPETQKRKTYLLASSWVVRASAAMIPWCPNKKKKKKNSGSSSSTPKKELQQKRERRRRSMKKQGSFLYCLMYYAKFTTILIIITKTTKELINGNGEKNSRKKPAFSYTQARKIKPLGGAN